MSQPPDIRGTRAVPTSPGALMMNAGSRLIPYDIPLRFFIAAALFHVLAWALLAYGHAEVAGFIGGPGVVLAAVHALTLGVLVMCAMGAAYQLLSVATGVALGSFFPCRLSSWLYIPGTAVLVGGMLSGDTSLMAIGGSLAVAGLVVFALVVGTFFHRAQTLKTTVRYGWAALACLALLAVAGLALVFDFEGGFLDGAAWPDHLSMAAAHAILGGYGFMGLLVMGFSHILVPMFALAAASDERISVGILGVNLLAIGLAVAGVLRGEPAVVLAAGAVGLGGIGGHLWLMVTALRNGMKKRLGLSFGLVRAGWILLVVSILAGMAVVALPDVERLAGLFGFILLFGWLLTFLTGILQRILPFLASMHAHHAKRRAPRLTAMGHQNVTLKMHVICHGLALAAIALGIVIDTETLVLAGALSGAVGAAAYLWFAAGVAKHIIGFYGTENGAEAP